MHDYLGFYWCFLNAFHMYVSYVFIWCRKLRTCHLGPIRRRVPLMKWVAMSSRYWACTCLWYICRTFYLFLYILLYVHRHVRFGGSIIIHAYPSRSSPWNCWFSWIMFFLLLFLSLLVRGWTTIWWHDFPDGGATKLIRVHYAWPMFGFGQL